MTDPQRDDRSVGDATTASSAPAAEPRPPVPGQQLTATPYVLALALSPIVTAVFSAIEIRRSVELVAPGSTGVTGGDFTLSLVVSVVVGVALVVLSWLDRRTLRQRGVERPFHWAWSILGVLIYLIGRSVVVRRRVGGSAAPLWLFLGLSVLGGAIAVIIGISSGVATMDRPPVEF
ncbi:hypothetical protein [Frigoribacterium faeni]|uniref:hypothetical protein n=1 Tax=Frigoribacterium faeni TaxID=145483 RepID=UPI00141A7794|nr:hypothetical protein [Frigoribacterium faeni]NIJ04501.1 hypothetical protein [Frigoribacterium faeni]